MTTSREETSRLWYCGFHMSEWALTNGGRSNYYWDLDSILTTPAEIEEVTSCYLGEIDQIRTTLGPIDRLGFIEKDSGPVGALTLKDLLIVRSNIPGVIIRQQRRILTAAIKGKEPLHPGERIVLISDVSTSGSGILKTAKIVWAFRAKVIAAIVFFDREQGAVENLNRVDIVLRSITRRTKELPDVQNFEKIPLNISTSSISYSRT